MRSVLLFVLIAVLGGCATTSRARQPKSPLEVMLDQARALLGQTTLMVEARSYRADCSGYVFAAFSAAGVDLIDPGARGTSGTELIYRTLQSRGRLRGAARLRPGDLLFFHNTWDRNGNRLRDDRFTHVAIVDSVDSDGTVGFLHFASGRVKRDLMNVRHRNTARDPDSGKTWNSSLRRGRGRVLAGQLFHHAGRPLP